MKAYTVLMLLIIITTCQKINTSTEMVITPATTASNTTISEEYRDNENIIQEFVLDEVIFIDTAAYTTTGVTLAIPKIGIETTLDVASVVATETGLEFTKPDEVPIWIPKWSKNIGQPGVSLIYGHRQWGIEPKVFSKLDKLELNDIIIVTSNTASYVFNVIDSIIIEPDQLWEIIHGKDVSAVENKQSQLALVTCTPWGKDTQRLIIFAKLQEVINE